MKTQCKTILDLDHKKALDYLMDDEQYRDIELPEYFSFTKVLKHVRRTIGQKKYAECCNSSEPTAENGPSVNLDILMNKDGRYGVRPLVIPNPYLYYFIAKLICAKQNWGNIKKCFSLYRSDHIKVCSMPVIRDEFESFHNSTTILNWWNSMEQRSIALALDYKYMFTSDISNCYGSIIPATLAWALGIKGTSDETTQNETLANELTDLLRVIQNGRNVGIPQGGVLFDFVGEIILGYADRLLKDRLDAKGITDYEILRYRDDYRIFSNQKDQLDDISYELQHILHRLNFMMSSKKTSMSTSIITDSIKPEKLDFLMGTPLETVSGYTFKSPQKHLLFIYVFAKEHPNCGYLKMLLSKFDTRLRNETESILCHADFLEDKKDKTDIETLRKTRTKRLQDIPQLIAIATQIALENVTACQYAIRTISILLDNIEDEDERLALVAKVHQKLKDQPNSSYSQIWLQNITYKQDIKQGKSPYDMPLCRIAVGEKGVELWNLSWLKPELTRNLPTASVCDTDKLRIASPVIVFRETRSRTNYDLDFFEEDPRSAQYEEYIKEIRTREIPKEYKEEMLRNKRIH